MSFLFEHSNYQVRIGLPDLYPIIRFQNIPKYLHQVDQSLAQSNDQFLRKYYHDFRQEFRLMWAFRQHMELKNQYQTVK